MVMVVLPAFSVGEKPITLTYWTLFSGGEGDYMTALVNQFNEEHPGIFVREERQPWGEYYKKLLAAMAGGNPPDIAIMHTATLPDFASRDTLYAIDKFEPELDLTDYMPNILAGGRYEGHQYALPIDVHPLVLFYNKTVLREAGLVDAYGHFVLPRTVDELIEYTQIAKERTGKGCVMESLGSYPWRLWFAWLYAQGGEFLDKEGNPAFNNEKGIRAAEALRSLSAEADVPLLTGDQSEATWQAGNAAFTIRGVWGVGTYTPLKNLDWGVTLLPTLPGEPYATWANSHNIVFPKQPKLSEGKLKAAIEFAIWLGKHSMEWAKAGHIPVVESARTAKEFLELPHRIDYMAAADYAVYPPAVVGWSAIEQTLIDMCQAIFTGRISPEYAMAELERKVKDILGRQ